MSEPTFIYIREMADHGWDCPICGEPVEIGQTFALFTFEGEPVTAHANCGFRKALTIEGQLNDDFSATDITLTRKD